MIAEWLEYLFYPCPRYVRRMGFLSELIGIRRRGKRQDLAWKPHLNKVIEVTKDAVQKSQNHDSVMVLGSGLLHDLPLDFLATNFKKVYLVDILHFIEVRKKVRKYSNVELLSVDISGVAKKVFSYKKGPYPTPTMPDLPHVNWVISLNLISQIPLPLIDWLKTDDEKWPKELILFHHQLIKEKGDHYLLIAERSQKEISDKDELLENYEMLYGVDLGNPLLTWTWDLAPLGESSKKMRIESTIEIYSDLSLT